MERQRFKVRKRTQRLEGLVNQSEIRRARRQNNVGGSAMTNFFMVMCATGIFYLGFDGALTDMTRNDCAAGVQAACEVLR